MRAESLAELVHLVLIAQGKSPKAKQPEDSVHDETS